MKGPSDFFFRNNAHGLIFCKDTYFLTHVDSFIFHGPFDKTNNSPDLEEE
jgi:hypothetical protein